MHQHYYPAYLCLKLTSFILAIAELALRSYDAGKVDLKGRGELIG